MSDEAGQPSFTTSKILMSKIMLLPAIACVIATVLLVLYFYEFAPGLSSDRGVWGQFGDYIGGTLNPVLSFLALIAIVLTYSMQTRQLEMAREEVLNSREELRLTREELKRTSAAQEAAANSVAEQAKYAAISAKISALGAHGATLSAQVAAIPKNDVIANISRPGLIAKIAKNSKQIEMLAASIDLET